MRIKRKDNLTNNIVMANQNIFASIQDRLNAKNLGATVPVKLKNFESPKYNQIL